MGEFEDIILAFIEAKIPKSQWGSLLSRYDILRKIEDDDEEEIKERLWEVFMSRINWVTVLNEIMVQAQDAEESENEEESDEDSEESDEE